MTDAPLIKPRIELRGITTNERLSEETNCYSALLFVNGEKWGETGNRGTGGCDDLRLVPGRSWDDVKALNVLIAATYPPLDFGEAGLDPIKADLEIVCGEIVADNLLLKGLKRDFRTRALFFKDGLPPEGSKAPLYEALFKNRNPQAVAEAIVAANPKAVVLNSLPVAEALVAYRRAA